MAGEPERKKIRFRRKALRDLEEIFHYIEERNPSAARTVATRIHEAIGWLETFPLIGRPGACDGTRELVVHKTPYIVVYAVEGPVVDIVAVFHAARNIRRGPR